jgi:hypothetical protein
MSTINTIHTPCKKCVFAQYDGITQTNCHLSYIDKYKESGVEILEAYDDEQEFYIINNKKCIGYREDKWFKQFDLEDDSIESKIKIYKDNNSLHYLVIVNLKNFTIESLSHLFDELSKTKTKPQRLILIRYRDPSLVFTYEKIEQLIKSYEIQYGWRIQTMLDENITYEEVLHNTTSINAKYRFIVSISEPTDKVAYLIDKTNTMVHDDLDQFMVITNDQKTVLIYSSAVYRFGIVHNANILAEQDKYTIL